ncbi:MAG: hypothetical protein LBL57_05170, partial [Tannerella sp.]|nr:hypothetical protein [Tannerella sp.]
RYKGGSDNIEVVFNENIKEIKVYNPAQYDAKNPALGTKPITTCSGVSSIPLTMTNHPFILELQFADTGNSELVYKD